MTRARRHTAQEEIEAAALRLFAERGVDAASVRHIAEAAGVSLGAMYNHFPSKEALVGHLFTVNYVALADELDAARLVEEGLRPRLRSLVATFCDLFDRDENLFRFLLLSQHGNLPALPKDVRTPVDVMIDTLAEAMEAGDVRKGDPVRKAAMVMGVVLQTATFRIYGRLSGPLADLSDDLSAACIAAAEA